jgi:ketosteroid isomerase-like protein
MEHSRICTALLLALLCTPLSVVPAQAQAAPQNDVERAVAEWFAAINAGDNIAGRKGYADDAAVVGPAGPIAFGRAEIDAQVAALTRIPGFHVDFTPERSGYSADGKIGFVVGESAISVITGVGKRQPQRQRLLLVWRKDKQGQWKCIFNVPMGAPAQPSP